MSESYLPAVLIVDDQFISIKNIESIGVISDDEQSCVDKLKDDITIPIRMSSGTIYTVSVREQMDVFQKHGVPDTLLKTYQAIIERWFYFIG